MIKFTIRNGRVYGKVGMSHGRLIVWKGIFVTPKAAEQFKSIFTQCIMDGIDEFVCSVESEMVDKTLAIYEVYGATGINGKDYY